MPPYQAGHALIIPGAHPATPDQKNSSGDGSSCASCASRVTASSCSSGQLTAAEVEDRWQPCASKTDEVVRRPETLESAESTPRKKTLRDVLAAVVEPRVGGLQFWSRFHQLPKSVHADYDLSRVVLGAGCSGDVVLATAKGAGGEQFAVKTLSLDGTASRRAEVKSEVKVLLCLDHPHIVQLREVYESEAHVHLVMEYLRGPELYDRILEFGRLPEPEAAAALRQMLLAIAYVHSQGAVHRDVKPENFRYDEAVSNGGRLKLLDFGFGVLHDPAKDRSLRSKVGTTDYVAPEVIGGSYCRACDLWSLGVVAFAMLVGDLPFRASGDGSLRRRPDAADVRRRVLAGEYSCLESAGLSREAADFVGALLTKSPARRLTAHKALAHPWLANAGAALSQTIGCSVVASLRAFPAKPAFERCCLSAMAWSLKAKDQVTLREHFLSMCGSERGVMVLDDVQRALAQMPDLQPQEALSVLAAMRAARGHSEGFEIRYSDFLAATAAPTDASLQAVFQKFGTSASEQVTAGDLRRVLGETFEGEDVSVLATRAGVLVDGGVSYAAFSSYLRADEADRRAAKNSQRVAEFKEERNCMGIADLPGSCAVQ